ncbi:hypothetical protein [Kiloniella sp.]|uniref:hypothetical protein n=1 Tax=Kiloniella sp. TaxID=1938587 RepID=UPI003B02A2D3
MLIVIYLLYVKLSETIHINRLLGGRHLFLLNKAEKSPNRELMKSMSKTCPDCAETVKKEARVCRYCRFEFLPKNNKPVTDS